MSSVVGEKNPPNAALLRLARFHEFNSESLNPSEVLEVAVPKLKLFRFVQLE